MGILQMVMSAVSAALGYNPKRSTRFNDDDSAYLNRTPGSAGNRRTWTWSGWVKRSNISNGYQHIFDANDSSSYVDFQIENDDQFNIYHTSGGNSYLTTTRLLRDVGAWYHIVVAFDTTQATSSDRVKIYINGTQETTFSSSTYPGQNDDLAVNNTIEHEIGGRNGSEFFDGYLADVNFCDGVQLDPTSFAETDLTTGQWIPKQFTHAASPNDGTTWSGTVTESEGGGWYSGNEPAYGFNNNISSTMKTQNGSTITFTPASGIPYTSSVEIYQDRVQTGATINGSAVTTPGTANAWNTLTTGSGTLNSLTVTGINNVSTVIAAIRIDGKQLVDGLVGDNSFHLAMDPAESGTIYSDNLSGARVGTNEKHEAFDGLLTTKAGTLTGGTLTWTPTGGVDYSQSVKVYTYWGTANDVDVAINGGNTVTDPGNQWTTIATGEGSITSMTFAATNNSGCVSAIEIDGSILVDHTAIGHDSSGQNNHWYENNLVAGDGYGKNWTSYIGGTVDSNYSITNLFQSPLGTSYTNGIRSTNPGTLTWDISSLNITVGTVTLHTYTYGTPSVLTVNGTTVTGYSNGDSSWDVAVNGQLNTIAWSYDSGTGPYCYMRGIELDGKYLQDAPQTDLLADVPGAPYDNSLYGGGNYATMNPLKSGLSLVNGNLEVSNSQSSSWDSVVSTMSILPGEKCYCEVDIISGVYSGNAGLVGLAVVKADAVGFLDDYLGKTTDSWYFQNNGGTSAIGHNNGWSSYGSTYTDGDVMGIAVDLSAGTLKFYKNGTDLGTAFSNLPTDTALNFACSLYNAGEIAWNFGQRTFAHTPPTGYKALNTYNLTVPTIVDPSDHFDVGLDAGDAILTTALGLTDGADFVWIKDRDNNSTDHILFNRINDSNMDGTPHLRSNENHTEATCGSYSAQQGNSVAWVWNAGSSTVTNTVGTIESEVRANTSAGFSIVSFDSGSSGNQTVGHGLNAKPDLILLKDRDASWSWCVTHKDLGTDDYLWLDNTDDVDNYADIWGTVAHTSDVFGFKASVAAGTSNDCTAYCWSEVAGYSKFGSYTGNNDADGPFIYCGFKPALLIIKKTNATDGWMMYDNKREPTNLNDNRLEANSDNDEYENGVVGLDFLSNGFKLRTSDDDTNNGSYVFCAWAEAPFRYANAR